MKMFKWKDRPTDKPRRAALAYIEKLPAAHQAYGAAYLAHLLGGAAPTPPPGQWPRRIRQNLHQCQKAKP